MKDQTAVMCHNIAKYDRDHNTPEMTAAEAAEILEIQKEKCPCLNCWPAFDMGVSAIRRVASGELAPVVRGHIVMHHRHIGGYEYGKCPECGTQIETQRPVDTDEPYCSVCGAHLAESFQDICPRCGAVMDKSSDGKKVGEPDV